ncbi:MotE family protein [Arvimicrobium flavum]|uniref:MotE family protein n=1 Tax=Arvimicrobium flavum TaxID=3393320 RepID=UPI00237B9BD9|nr:MotE family protein [Mesorhizobium shangrilense]
MTVLALSPIRLAFAASAGLLLFCLPASTQTADAVRQVGPQPVVAAPASEGSADEIQRFCGNIADAARDRRYALQAKELEQLQAEIDERMKALDAKRVEYETWMKKREAFLAQAQDGLVKIYGGMKPDAAAERLAELKPDLAAGILIKLDTRKASVILNEMKSKEAAVLTTIMASVVRREDPT